MKLFSDYGSLSDKEKKIYEQAVKFLYTTVAIAVVLFYIMPFILSFFGKVGYAVWLVSYISVYPAFVFCVGLLYSKKYGFDIIIPAALGLFFFPTTIIFVRNLSSLPFVFAYFVLGLFGEFTGYLFNRRAKSKRQPIGLNRLVKMAESMDDKKDAKKKDNKNKIKKNDNNKKNNKK